MYKHKYRFLPSNIDTHEVQMHWTSRGSHIFWEGAKDGIIHTNADFT